MNKTFNFYCDESCHLENDRQPYMIIGYVSSAVNQIDTHKRNIKLLKDKFKFNAEIKWSHVSGSKYPFYAELVDYFFATDLQFRAIVVDKNQIDNQKFDQSYDTFYYKMYYQLLHHKINMSYQYNIFIDAKDSLTPIRLRKLREVLNIDYNSIRNLQIVPSHESLMMQLADLLMGAVSYHLRGKDTMLAKTKLIEKIETHTALPLTVSTPKDHAKFNLFFIDLKRKLG